MKVTFGSALLATTVASLVTNVVAMPAQSNPLQARQSNTQYDQSALIGMRAKDGSLKTVVRPNIKDMQNDQPLWACYINGLVRMMDPKNVNSARSYYAIAAIHGSDTTYNNLPWRPQGSGYCMHGSIHFPAWHRPYMGLFEYALSTWAQQWVDSLPQNQRAQYNSAMDRFRVPYWDWAEDATMPQVLTQQTIQIFTGQGGNTQNIQNPLFSYKSNTQFLALSGRQVRETLRSPDSSFTSQNSDSQNNLNNGFSGLRNSINTLFQRIDQWDTFASQSVSGDSIEAAHGGPHVEVGGFPGGRTRTSGHMSLIPQAGYDPSFWLHHANVDRQFAIWQVINPNAYVTGNDLNTAYTPFWDWRSGKWHTAATSKNVQDFGYTYPELQRGWSAAEMKRQMQTKYGGRSPRSTISQATNQNAKRQNGTDGGAPEPLKSTKVAAATVDTKLSTPADANKLAEKGKAKLLNSTTSYNEYRVDCTVPSSATDGTFSILFFIGNYTKDPKGWRADPNFVGAMNSFTKGKKMANAMNIKGSVQLTQAVLNLINRDENPLNDLTVPNVSKYLEANIRYEVQVEDDGAFDKKAITLNCETANVATTKAVDSGAAADEIWGPYKQIFKIAN